MAENSEALEMLKNALDMEEKGKKFYEKAVKECPNEIGKEIFQFLRDEEIKHFTRIKEIYQGLLTGEKWNEKWVELPGSKKDIKPIFRELAKKYALDIKAGPSELEALNIGIDFEAAAIKYYENHLNRAKNPLERKFIEHLIEEEREHYKILEDLKYYYTDPEAWMMEKGRAGLDGA